MVRRPGRTAATLFSGGYIASGPPGLAPRAGLLASLRRLGVSPRAHPDFGWDWAMHFLVNLGNALGTLYLLYFLSDAAHYPDPQTGLLILMAIHGVSLAAADRAKDLGVINIAVALPLVVAPLIAGVVLGATHSYPLLFALSGLATVGGGAAVLPIRAVR